jgi:serine/threonine-protein kinase RsbW
MMNGQGDSAGFQHRFVIGNRADEIRSVQTRVVEETAARGYDEAACFAIRLALEEALTNAFKHGNRDHPDSVVTLDCRINADAVNLEIKDEGEGFDPRSVPDPTTVENVEIPSGRGIVLMRAFMTEVRYFPPGNRLRMTYRR